MADDIHQDRFALMTVLTRAHAARPDDYTGCEALMAMGDELLLPMRRSSYAPWKKRPKMTPLRWRSGPRCARSSGVSSKERRSSVAWATSSSSLMDMRDSEP